MIYLPPQDVGAADGAEGPEEARGSRSNRELENDIIRVAVLYSFYENPPKTIPVLCHLFSKFFRRDN